MASDTFFPVDPSPWNGDQFCNTVHSGGGGDVFFNIKTPISQDTIWDILNETDQDTVWDILNETDQDTVWDILNATAKVVLWDILNDPALDTAWHIFPATIPYIAQYVLAGIQHEFEMNLVNHSFETHQIQSSFVSNPGIDEEFALLAPPAWSTEILWIQTSFELKTEIQTNFTITRVYNDNVDTPEYPSL